MHHSTLDCKHSLLAILKHFLEEYLSGPASPLHYTLYTIYSHRLYLSLCLHAPITIVKSPAVHTHAMENPAVESPALDNPVLDDLAVDSHAAHLALQNSAAPEHSA